MRIGHLARRTGLSLSRIRFYEARGLLPAAQREANGYRSYPEEAVAMLQFVDQAQKLGFSLAEIHASIPSADLSLPAPAMIVAALQRKSDEIDRLIEAAAAKKVAIAVLLKELDCVA